MAAVLRPTIDDDPVTGISLADLPPGTFARVVRVAGPADGVAGDLSLRLAALGFLPGEAVRIVARGFPSNEPIAVRVGTGTFALRRFEAAAVRVQPERASNP